MIFTGKDCWVYEILKGNIRSCLCPRWFHWRNESSATSNIFKNKTIPSNVTWTSIDALQLFTFNFNTQANGFPLGFTGRTCITPINHDAILIWSRFTHVSIPPLFLVLILQIRKYPSFALWSGDGPGTRTVPPMFNFCKCRSSCSCWTLSKALLRSRKQGPQRVWKVWKKYGICFFNFQTWKKHGNLWKALETSKKGLELFAFYLRKILKTESVPPARKLLPRVWPKAVRGLYRLFTFVPIHRTNCLGQAQSCLPAASNKKGTLGTVRLSRKDRSQVRPWILILDWRCSWTKSLRRSRSFAACFWLYRLHGVTSAKMWLLFARSNFRCLSETASKARQALVSLALFSFFFLFVEESVGEVLEVCLSRSWSGCGRTRPDCLFAIDACQITCKTLPVSFRPHRRESLSVACGSDLESRRHGIFRSWRVAVDR